MVRCVLARSSTFLAVGNASASAFSTAKNVELPGLYPILKYSFAILCVKEYVCAKYEVDLQGGLQGHTKYHAWIG